MGKPVKIHKKKSFMFTTRHYSFMSIVAILLGVFSTCVSTTLVIYSFRNAGTVGVSYGSIGLFSMMLNIIGTICGTLSLQECDIYITPAIVAIVINGINILAWIVMIIISAIA